MSSYKVIVNKLNKRPRTSFCFVSKQEICTIYFHWIFVLKIESLTRHPSSARSVGANLLVMCHTGDLCVLDVKKFHTGQCNVRSASPSDNADEQSHVGNALSIIRLTLVRTDRNKRIMCVLNVITSLVRLQTRNTGTEHFHK